MRKQSGVTLVELIISIAIIGLISVGVASMQNLTSEDTKASVTALHLKTIGDKANDYIQDNYATLTTIATPTQPALIRVSDLIAGGYLTTGYSVTNPRGQATCVVVLEPSANNLNAVVVTEGGETIDDLTLGQIAALVGGAGGGIYSTNASNIRGAMGGYDLPIGNYANANNLSQTCSGVGGTINLTAGHPAMALFYADGNAVSATLYRDEIPGNPTLNTMNTPILMGTGTIQTIGAACTSTGALGRTSTGSLVTCVSGFWAAAGGSQYWQDPVATFVTLPVCNAASINQTRVVMTPTVGTSRRAYTCNGSGTWQALAVDNNGNLTVDGVLTVSGQAVFDSSVTIGDGTAAAAGNTLVVNRTATAGGACSPNGAIARDSTGLILSCQSSIWKSQGSDGGVSGMYVYFNMASCPSGWVVANGTNGTIDLRGEFIRGLDNGRGVDSGRVLASSQTDLFRAHNHYAGHGIKGDIARQFGTTGWLTSVTERTSFSGGQPYTSTTGGAETRPRNVALLPCMKQ